MRASPSPRTPFASVVLLGCAELVAACDQHKVAAPMDVAVAADATPGPSARRRRGRRGTRHGVARNGAGMSGNNGSANGHVSSDRGAADPGAASAEDLALGDDPGGDDSEPVATARPRITETGPMLPENVGTQSVNYDMTGASAAGDNGPMGLEPSQISAGMHPLMSRFTNCAAATGAHGHVAVRLRIQSSGTPSAARVSGPGPGEFITCVRRVVASARFDRFHGPDALASWGFDVD